MSDDRIIASANEVKTCFMTELHFYGTVKKFGMDSLLSPLTTVIVGYSGGADSSCLLRLMDEWCSVNDVKLVAAHVNHMIRGAESERDEEFCRKTAERLNIPFFVRRVDVPALSRESGTGLEETARNIRYDFFGELSEMLTGRRDGAFIATAHNSTDNLETVLMNLMRGSGLHGMCGIAPVRDGRIIRPLICDTAESIRAWCEENNVPYVTDSTNFETDCTRNAVRHKIIPVMRNLCSSPEDRAVRMTSLLRADEEFILSEVEKYAVSGVTVPRETVVSAAPAVASRLLMRLYNNAKHGDSVITEGQISDIIRLSRDKTGHCEVSLAGGLKAVIERDSVTIKDDCKDERESGFVFEYGGGDAVFENELYRLTFSQIPPEHGEEKIPSKENIYKLSIYRSFACDKIKGKLKIRYRSHGDSYVYCGHTHKLKKLFTDAKLTEREKRLTPVLCDDDGIVWVAGFGTRDGVRLTQGRGIYLLCEKK